LKCIKRQDTNGARLVYLMANFPMALLATQLEKQRSYTVLARACYLNIHFLSAVTIWTKKDYVNENLKLKKNSVKFQNLF
jgi:hypothetical protein